MKPSLEEMIEYLLARWTEDIPALVRETVVKDDEVLSPAIESENFVIAWKGKEGNLKDLVRETYLIEKNKHEKL